MADHDYWVDEPTDIRGTRWIGIALAVGIIAVLLRQPLLLVLALVLILCAASARLWWRFGLSEVRYHRRFSASSISFGEDLDLELVVENAKPLPLIWLDLVDEFPLGVDIAGIDLEPAGKPMVGIFRTFFAIQPYERVRRHYRLRGVTRGYHRFGPTTLTTGDPFGFSAREIELPKTDHLIVYPRMVSMAALGFPAQQSLGNLRPVRPLIEDPLRVAGIRPYIAGDSPRRIHWWATARTGTLQAKHYERTADLNTAIFLDANTFEFFWEGQNTELLELAITTAASLAAHVLESRQSAGLFVNAPYTGTGRMIRILPGRHPGQLVCILEALALLVDGTGNRIEELVAQE